MTEHGLDMEWGAQTIYSKTKSEVIAQHVKGVMKQDMNSNIEHDKEEDNIII